MCWFHEESHNQIGSKHQRKPSFFQICASTALSESGHGDESYGQVRARLFQNRVRCIKFDTLYSGLMGTREGPEMRISDKQSMNRTSIASDLTTYADFIRTFKFFGNILDNFLNMSNPNITKLKFLRLNMNKPNLTKPIQRVRISKRRLHRIHSHVNMAADSLTHTRDDFNSEAQHIRPAFC